MRKFFILLFLSLSALLAQDKSGFRLQKYSISDSTISFRGISISQDNEIWVSGSGGSVYRYDDSGKMFSRITVPNSDKLDFRDIQKLGEKKIILMSSGPGSSSKILVSEDNGKNWKCSYENNYKDGFLDSFEFWNEKNGIAMGDPVNGRLNILLTENGGDEWKECDSTGLPGTIIGEAAFAASGSCISVLDDNTAWMGTGGSTARIFKTTDGGKNWKVFATPIISGSQGAGIFAVYFSDMNNGIIVGGNYMKDKNKVGTAAITNDGGINWIPIEEGTLPYLSAVKEFTYKKEKCFIAAGTAGVFVSYDRNNWKLISSEGFNCIGVSPDGKSVWLAGSKGNIAELIYE